MIKNLNNNENVDIKSLFNLDQDVASMVKLLQSEIDKARLNKWVQGEIVANYHTYNYSFENNEMIISGLVEGDAMIKIPLDKFLAEISSF